MPRASVRPHSLLPVLLFLVSAGFSGCVVDDVDRSGADLLTDGATAGPECPLSDRTVYAWATIPALVSDERGNEQFVVPDGMAALVVTFVGPSGEDVGASRWQVGLVDPLGAWLLDLRREADVGLPEPLLENTMTKTVLSPPGGTYAFAWDVVGSADGMSIRVDALRCG